MNKIALTSLVFILAACSSTPPAKLSESQIDKAGVRAVIREHLPQLKACYMEATAKNPQLAGKVAVLFRVSDQGRIAKAEVVDKKSTLHDAELSACVVNEIKSLKLPASPEGTFVQVTYPFVFQEADVTMFKK